VRVCERETVYERERQYVRERQNVKKEGEIMGLITCLLQ
jgi:hypothetical protein